VSGTLSLPPAETSIEILGLNLADVGFAIEPVGPTTGTFDLSTLTVTMTSSFNIKIPHLNPLGLDFINLVGSRCQTATPITLTPPDPGPRRVPTRPGSPCVPTRPGSPCVPTR
jgi:hypothetical protein